MYSGHSRPAVSDHAKTDAPNTISIPFVLLASVLMGVGLLLTLVWLITFNWLLFPGVGVVVVGALMVLSPKMGSDHA
ncbi:MAG: hypothetical protein L3J81_03580 [Thermoplasmata archaeon]|jgi:hypothetical protein|nr:hypothetical protein [Thermoplasmata archaeon]